MGVRRHPLGRQRDHEDVKPDWPMLPPLVHAISVIPSEANDVKSECHGGAGIIDKSLEMTSDFYGGLGRFRSAPQRDAGPVTRFRSDEALADRSRDVTSA